MRTELAVRFFLYVLYLSGLFLCLESSIHYIKRKIKLIRRLPENPDRKKTDMRLFSYANEVLSVTLGSQEKVTAFKGFELLLFIAIMFFGIRNFTLAAAFLSSFMVVFMPFLILCIKLLNDRNRGSREGISLVSELFRQYRMNKLNIYTAMELCCSNAENFPVTGKHLYRLLLRLRSSGHSDIRSACDDFSFALGTLWGRMLALCIRLAASEGTDVSEGLSDIASQLKAAEKRMENRKRLNGEAARMTFFFVPVLYMGTMIMAVRYLEAEPSKLLYNQFMTPGGFMFFLMISFMFFMNMVFIRLIDATKMDY